MKFVLALAFGDPTHSCELARTAEEAGWDAIALSDHVFFPEKLTSPYPYADDGVPRFGPDDPFPDPWVAIGAMAAVTTRIRFLTNIYILPLRNPIVVAKTVGTAALMSNDRVSLGIGMGWMREEFDLLGEDFRRRGRRADEMIDVMRKLWTGGMVEHHGEFFDFDRLQVSPAPSQPVPILVGGISEPALRRIGKLGDGWVSDIHTIDELGAYVEKIGRYREEYGRADVPLEVVASPSDARGIEDLRRMGDLGITHMNTMPWHRYGGPTEDLEKKKDGIKRFAEDLIEPLR